MFHFFRRYLARRRLRPVVGTLPQRLAEGFTACDRYTVGQVQRTIADMGLDEQQKPFALAAACAFETLREADVSMSISEYHRLRAVLARLFDLRGPDFTMKDLRAIKRYSTHHPAGQNEYATTDGHHGS